MRRFLRLSYVWLAMHAALLCGWVRAEEYTLANIVEQALRDSDLLRSDQARVEERRHAADQARALPNPSMDFLAGQREEDAESGPLVELDFVQPVPLFGKPGLRGDIASVQTQGSRIRQTADELRITLEVIRLGYEYAVLRRKVGLLEARQKRFELMRSYLTGRVFASPQQKAESRIVENRLRRLTSDSLRTLGALRAALEKLKTYVAFPSGDFPSIEVPWLAGGRVLDEPRWVEIAAGGNLDLAVQKLSIQGARLEKTLAVRDAWPEPSFLASYSEGTAASDEKELEFGFSVGLPLWNRNEAGTRSAMQKVIAEERLLGFQRRQLQSELLKALGEYDAARKVAGNYPQNLFSELDADIKEAEEEFRKGRVDMLAFLELDSEVWENFERALDAQLALAGKIVELLALSGEKKPLDQLGQF